MRTTVTLDPDAEQVVRDRMKRHGVSFKQALNDAIRAGAAGRPRADYSTTPVSLGRPTLDLDRASQVAAELEDEERARRMRSGS